SHHHVLSLCPLPPPRPPLSPYTTLFRSHTRLAPIVCGSGNVGTPSDARPHKLWRHARPYRIGSRNPLYGAILNMRYDDFQFLVRSEEHTSELQSREIPYAVFCLKKENLT